MEGLDVINIGKLLTGKTGKTLNPSDYPLPKFDTAQVYGVELDQIFQRFLKNGYGHDRLKNYAVFIYGEYTSKKPFVGRIYRDTKYYFVLCVKREKSGPFFKKRYNYIACVGFDETTNLDGSVSITIQQLQGRRGAMMHLAHIKWERLLVRIVTDWAYRNGYSTIKMIRAVQNPWYSSANSQQMYLRYDVTARRSGFKFIPEEDIYVLNFP